MATGDFWNVSNPLKPWGYFDPDDVLTIPFDFSEWLTSQSTTYVSHVLTPADGLLMEDAAAVANGVILVQVSKDPSGTLTERTKYPITCQLVAADGQKQSQTLWLKVREL